MNVDDQEENASLAEESDDVDMDYMAEMKAAIEAQEQESEKSLRHLKDQLNRAVENALETCCAENMEVHDESTTSSVLPDTHKDIMVDAAAGKVDPKPKEKQVQSLSLFSFFRSSRDDMKIR